MLQKYAAKYPETDFTFEYSAESFTVTEVDYALEGRHEAAIYDGEKLAPGMNFDGPAIIEDSGSTVVIHPGNGVYVDAFRNLHIELEGQS